MKAKMALKPIKWAWKLIHPKPTRLYAKLTEKKLFLEKVA